MSDAYDGACEVRSAVLVLVESVDRVRIALEEIQEQLAVSGQCRAREADLLRLQEAQMGEYLSTIADELHVLVEGRGGAR